MKDTADYWLFYFRSPFPAPRSPFLVLVTSCQDHSLYDFKKFSSFAFETVKIIFAVHVAEVNTYYYLN